MPTLIENFNNLTEEDFSSYPGQDVDINGFELTGGKLHIYGNTWKIFNPNTPIRLGPSSVWSIQVKINDSETNTSEIQGFGLAVYNNGTIGDRIKYSLGGVQEVDSDDWEWTYQNAFPSNEWNTYELEVGKDFFRKYGYYPTIQALYFFNDDDPDGGIDLLGSIEFDDLYDITDTNTQPPSLAIAWQPNINEDIVPTNSLDVNFTPRPYTNPQEIIEYYWDFGDGTTSIESNPSHIFDVSRNQIYKVTCKVKDVNNKWGWASAIVKRQGTGLSPVGRDIKMVFTGDVMMSRRFECLDYPECNQPGLIPNFGINYLFEPTLSLLNEADLKIINLETVISDTNEENAHPGKSILLKADPSTIEGLIYIGTNKVSLANNHSGDYMEQGLIDTKNLLDANNIKYSGAGLNSYEAYLPENISYEGKNIAFISVSDRHGQYSNVYPTLNAGYNKSGFANAELYDIGLVINSLQEFSDLNVVELHAGSEYDSTPNYSARTAIAEYSDDYDYTNTPRDADRAFRQELAFDRQVDLIVAHHPHVLQGVEWYANTLIVHSLGNFIFDSNYPETFPSMLFYATTRSDRFKEYEFKPIFIDHYLTKPAVGELGTQILDYVANLSRDLDTIVSVDKYTNTARLIKDYRREPINNYVCVEQLLNGVVVYDEDSGNVLYQYDLIRIPDIANISFIPSLQISNYAKLRVGREKVWFGNMEDEGANLWLLNSPDEYYSTEDSFRGSRSIRHNRSAGNSSSILTSIEKRLPLNTGTLNFSMHAAIKTINSPQAKLEIVYYPDRYGDSIGTQLFEIFPSGTIDWRVYEQELVIPDGTTFFNLKIKSWPPTSGSSIVYWDDVGLIEWEDWNEFGNNIQRGVQLKNPNDYYYLQVKTQENLTGHSIAFNEKFYGERLVQGPETYNQCRSLRPLNPRRRIN